MPDNNKNLWIYVIYGSTNPSDQAVTQKWIKVSAQPASDEKREIQRRLPPDFIWFLTQVGSAIELLPDQSLFNAQLD